MKPLSKRQQETLVKNMGYPVKTGMAAMNARGKLLPTKRSQLVTAVAASLSKLKQN